MLSVSTVSVRASPRALLAWVPTPKVSVPLSVAAPVSGTVGNVKTTPLLSRSNSVTGLAS